MTFKEFFSFKSNKMFWLNIIGMVVFIFIAVYLTMTWLDSYTMHGKSISVPDLSRMSLSESGEILQRNELKYVVTDSSYMKGVPPQTVIQQTPAAGKKVKEGRTIYLTISSKKIPLQKIPDVIDNSSLREAEARLVAAGFRVGETEYVDNAAKDWVLGLKFNGRELERIESIPEGSTVVIVAGNGNADPTIGMPEDSLSNNDALSDTNDENSWF